MEIDLKQLRELMRSLKQFDVNELEIEKDGERIHLRRGATMSPADMVASGAVMTMPAANASIPPPPALPDVGSVPVSAVTDLNLVTITSPFVGTFYRQPSPDAPSFVDVGAEIRPGQVLCIVEAMKLMNEIESEISGTVVEVVASNGKPVEYGDVLFKVRQPG